MKRFIQFPLFCFVILLASQAYGQVFAPSKVAVIDTDALSDPKVGITRLVSAMNGVAQKHKPDEDEPKNLSSQIEALANDLQANSAKYDQKTIAEKTDKGQSLQRQFAYRQEDIKKAFDKDMQTATSAIFVEISTALQAYAKQRGIDMVIDVAKIPGSVLVLNNAVDITNDFAKSFNAKGSAVPVR